MHYSFKKTVYMDGDGKKKAIHQLLKRIQKSMEASFRMKSFIYL